MEKIQKRVDSLETRFVNYNKTLTKPLQWFFIKHIILYM